MARFQIIKQLAFLPLTSPTSRSSATTTSLAVAAAVSRRHFVHVASVASLFLTATTPGFASSPTRMMASSSSSPPKDSNDDAIDLGFLDAASAASLDEELMQTPGFTLEQLMELAGLSVAEAAYEMISSSSNNDKTQILVICGPGNNGGDGLVAARHLHHFGFQVVVVYPKRSSRQPHYTNLVKQCEDLEIPVLDAMPTDDLTRFGLVLDSIFGFSFQGEPREPFRSILQIMRDMQQTEGWLILSVDVPSGWNVNEGDVTESGFVPDAVISLTAPKACMRTYPGRHFVGGRFLPPALADKYQVRMPPYPGVSQVLQISRGGDGSAATDAGQYQESWEAGYAAYSAEKEANMAQSDANAASSSSSWEAQYAAYCAEKEARLAAENEAAKKV
eukprot:scaffold9272_cov195-Amphora_coffeaeformis.AAC.6